MKKQKTSEQIYAPALKKLRTDTKKFLNQEKNDCPTEDIFNTDVKQGYANSLLNKFLNLTN